MTRILVDRVPTDKELEQMYADQVAAEYVRFQRTFGRGGSPGALPEVDVLRPQPRIAEDPAPVVREGRRPPPVASPCTVCGRLFYSPRAGTAKAMATKHRKAEHRTDDE